MDEENRSTLVQLNILTSSSVHVTKFITKVIRWMYFITRTKILRNYVRIYPFVVNEGSI